MKRKLDLNDEPEDPETWQQIGAPEDRTSSQLICKPEDSQNASECKEIINLQESSELEKSLSLLRAIIPKKYENSWNVSSCSKEVEKILIGDHENQINIIKTTFEEAKIPILMHHSKPNVFPVEILPVFPDFKNWHVPFAELRLDADPGPSTSTMSKSASKEAMSQAIISGLNHFNYYLPTKDTLLKRQLSCSHKVATQQASTSYGIPSTSEEKYDYKETSSYDWSVVSKATTGYKENYFVDIRPDGVFYNELESRMFLHKRKETVKNNTSVLVKYGVPSTLDFVTENHRKNMLLSDECYKEEDSGIGNEEMIMENQDVTEVKEDNIEEIPERSKNKQHLDEEKKCEGQVEEMQVDNDDSPMEDYFSLSRSSIISSISSGSSIIGSISSGSSICGSSCSGSSISGSSSSGSSISGSSSSGSSISGSSLSGSSNSIFSRRSSLSSTSSSASF